MLMKRDTQGNVPHHFGQANFKKSTVKSLKISRNFHKHHHKV